MLYQGSPMGIEIVSRLSCDYSDAILCVMLLETHLVTEQWIFQFHACVEVNLKFKAEEFGSFVTQFYLYIKVYDKI